MVAGKALPARRAKLDLIEVMRDLAPWTASSPAGVLPLLDEFLLSRGKSEQAACLVAVTRVRHTYPELKTAAPLHPSSGKRFSASGSPPSSR